MFQKNAYNTQTITNYPQGVQKNAYTQLQDITNYPQGVQKNAYNTQTVTNYPQGIQKNAYNTQTITNYPQGVQEECIHCIRGINNLSSRYSKECL